MFPWKMGLFQGIKSDKFNIMVNKMTASAFSSLTTPALHGLAFLRLLPA
jgi:hypothetical protein